MTDEVMHDCLCELFIYYWQTAASDMESTIQEMESQGVQSYILDLRNNPVIFKFFENYYFYSSKSRT